MPGFLSVSFSVIVASTRVRPVYRSAKHPRSLEWGVYCGKLEDDTKSNAAIRRAVSAKC